MNHTRFPKEDHLPYWARRDNKVTKGDRVEVSARASQRIQPASIINIKNSDISSTQVVSFEKRLLVMSDFNQNLHVQTKFSINLRYETSPKCCIDSDVVPFVPTDEGRSDIILFTNILWKASFFGIRVTLISANKNLLKFQCHGSGS